MQLTTDMQDLVLLGGGHSHLSVIKNLAMKPVPGLRITVISRDIHTPYSGMMPGLIAGHYKFDETHIDLRPLCELAGARLFHSTVMAVDMDQQLVHCDNRPPIRFDWLSINTGSTPRLAAIPGATETGLAVKPIDQFLQAISALEQQLLSNTEAHSIAVVGGGAASIEVLLALQYRLKRTLETGQNTISFKLICGTNQLLPTHNNRVRRHFLRLLEQRNIELHTGSPVTSAEGKVLLLDNGEQIHADTSVWALTAGSPQWPAEAGLDCDKDGFIRVNRFLQSSSHPQVFAAGDAIHFSAQPLAKSGVYAVRAGLVLSDNLRNVISNKPLTPYKPQKKFLSLLMSGEQGAIASRGPFSISGHWVWRWKHRIDSNFIKRFSQLPAMNSPRGEDSPMRCGGCGAKVGSSILQRVMADLNAVPKDNIIIGLKAPDDAAVIQPPPGKALVQTVDYFRSFIDDPYLIGRIATNHCLSDIYAMGATPHSALAIVTLPHQSEKLLEDSLRQLMLGAMESLKQQQTSLIGGHTSEGAELGFGLSVNGFIDSEKVLRKNQAEQGQKIIMSKALGTGTLLVANMHNAAQGRWIDYAIEQMLIDNSKAAEIIYQFGATACTDITGFGLLGHLLEILRASSVGADLHLNAVPTLPGSDYCLEKQFLSTLHPQNFNASFSIINGRRFKNHPLFNILFDPQTAGGLLATIPANQANACLQALHNAGLEDACEIGSIEDSIIPGNVLLS
jgi:selenide,water dikinase